MIRVVPDSNVLVSAFLTPGGTVGVIRRLRRDGALEVWLSQAILDEVAASLHWPKISRLLGLRAGEISEYLELLKREEILVEPAINMEHAGLRDPRDEAILNTALAARLAIIVTGDQDLPVLQEVRGIRIQSPSAFLAEHRKHRRK